MPKVKANEILINYETRGTGDPVLFIHGSGMCWKMWEPQSKAFSNRYKMIMVDLRGHGESSKEFPGGKYSISLLAEDIKCFLDALGITKIPIVGLSQGAIVASLFACKHPEYVEKLVLSSGSSELLPKLPGWVRDLTNIFFSLIPYKIVLKLAMRVYDNHEYTKQVIQNSLSIDKQMFLNIQKAEFPTHTSDLYKITAPTLILAGDKISIMPEVKAAKIMSAHIPNSQLTIIKDAFDPLNAMSKDTFNEIVINFLTTPSEVNYLDNWR
jgi:3-oxoadipate enol-lactonase